MKIMTFRKWKWLHRLVYFGGVLAVLHTWSIGTHLGSGLVQVISFIALIVLAGLELFRVTTLLSKKYKKLKIQKHFISLFIFLWLTATILIGSIPYLVDTYRDTHSNHDEHSHSEGDSHE